jgi:serine/threonine protein kinase
VHRDIKPENLIFDSKGFLYITDFGISRKYTHTPLTELSGTPCYMAPEILMKAGHSYSVDIYAMGIILYEFMMGCRPYRGRTRKEVLTFYRRFLFIDKRANYVKTSKSETSEFNGEME